MLYYVFSLPWIPFEYHQNMIGATKDFTAEIWAYATTLWEIFSHGQRPTLREYYASKRKLPKPRDCPEDMFEIMKEGWHESPDRRFTPQAVFSKLFLARKYQFKLFVRNENIMKINTKTNEFIGEKHIHAYESMNRFIIDDNRSTIGSINSTRTGTIIEN